MDFVEVILYMVPALQLSFPDYTWPTIKHRHIMCIGTVKVQCIMYMYTQCTSKYIHV